MRKFVFAVMSLMMLAGVVQAREEFWYAGVSGGVTFLNDKDDLFNDLDEKSSTYRAYVGYRVSTYIALEMDYGYYGEYNYRGVLDNFSSSRSKGKAEYEAITGYIVVMYPLIWDGFELYTPIGLSYVDAQTDIKDKSTAGYKLGFGVAYTFDKHFTMRAGADVLVFDLEGSDEDYQQNISSLYMSIQYNF